MTKKMGLMALGLSMALLSGCGSSNDDGAGDGAGDAVLNTPAVVTKNIVGAWSEGCEPDNGWSESGVVTLYADGTGKFEGSEYSSSDCKGDVEESWFGTFTYKVGEATEGSKDEKAVELDLVITEDGETMDYYTMVHFTTDNSFIMADDGDDDDDNADTPEEREDIFESGDVMVRQ